MRKPVWCLTDSEGVVAIFKNKKRAAQSGAPWESIIELSYAFAVGQVRDYVFARSEGHCEKCGDEIVKERGMRRSMHMHEKLHRGQFDENGWSGQISRENSVGLCRSCHLGDEHGDRNPQWS